MMEGTNTGKTESGGSSLSLTTFKPSRSLNTYILQYYNEFIHNDTFQNKQEAAFKLFEEDMQHLLETPHNKGLLPGRIVIGSFPEGTYINDNGIEFDINVIFLLSKQMEFEIKPSLDYKGFVTLVDLNDSNHLFTHSEVLEPILAQTTQVLETHEQELLLVMRNIQFHGPAIKMDKWGPKRVPNDQRVYEYTADVAPAFEITQGETTQLWVAKGPRKYKRIKFSYENRQGETRNIHIEAKNEPHKDTLHRVSKSTDETDTIRSLSEEKRAVLRICKQMLYMMNNSKNDYLKLEETANEAEILDSYILKNALLHVVFRPELQEEDWAREHITQRVIDLWSKIYAFLESGNFPAYVSRINLLLCVPEELLTFLMDRIAAFLISEDEFLKIFDRDSLRDKLGNH